MNLLRTATRCVLALGFVCSALYHVVGIYNPEWTEPSSVSRHLLFVFINTSLFILLWKRSRFFWLVLFILMLQQVYGHGKYAIEVYHLEHRIDWASVLVLLVLPFSTWVLFPSKEATS